MFGASELSRIDDSLSVRDLKYAFFEGMNKNNPRLILK
jgi:hypothetical protein